jgi:hypothetical protein
MTADDTAATGTVDTSATEATTTEVATDATTTEVSEGNTATTETTATADTAVPEAYEFSLPEGMTLDQGLLDKATPTFKELGLTNEQASKLVGIYAEHVKAMGEGAGEAAESWYQERRTQEIAQANEAGLSTIKADPEIGGNQFDAVRSRVVEAVGAKGTPELRQTFDKLGLANDPEIVRFINRLIDYTPTDKGERAGGAGGTGDAPIESRMYPGMSK